MTAARRAALHARCGAAHCGQAFAVETGHRQMQSTTGVAWYARVGAPHITLHTARRPWGHFHSTCSGRQARPVPSSVHWPAPVHRLAAVIGDVGQPRLNVVHTAHSTGHGTEVYCSHTQFTVHHGRSRATHCQLSINFHMQYERQDVTTPSTSPGPSPSPLALGRVRHTGALHPARRTPAHSSSAGGGMSLELDYCTRHYIPLSWAA